jgi:hypothetical protein
LYQGNLREALSTSGKTVKWGLYLRAPQVYFKLLEELKSSLTLLKNVAPPAYCSKSGINEFFHLDKDDILKWRIDDEFLFPLLKSISETPFILIQPDLLRLKVFVCRLSKEELKQKGYVHTLNYIEWGEKQIFRDGVQAGLTWPHGATVQGRKPGWYALPEYASRSTNVFIGSAFGDRHLCKYSPNPIIADKRLFFLAPSNDINSELISAILNSFITALFIEIAGRVSLGDGALELTIEDASDHLLVPDIHLIDQASRQAILHVFKPLLERPIGSVFEEVGRADRQALDSAVLQAIGLDPDVWLARIYDGLITLVRERTQLGQMRSQKRKSRPQKAAGLVAEEVLQDLMPGGPRRFPDDFYSAAARSGQYKSIPLPETPFRYRGPMIGKEELETEDGVKLFVNNKFEVLFILYAQENGQRVARLPEKPVEVSRTVNDYKRYLRDLHQQLYEAYFRRTLDQAQAQRFVADAWRKYHLPDSDD